MGGLPDPDWYFEHVLVDTEPGGSRRVDGPMSEWQSWWMRQQQSGDEVLRAAAAQGFVLRAGDLTDLGVSRQRARTAVKRGRWVAPAYGVVAPLTIAEAGMTRPTQRRRRHTLAATAAVLVRTDHVISGRSAAILHGLPTYAIPERPELTDAQPVSLGRSRGPYHVRGAQLFFDEVTTWFAAPLTTIERTLVDLARHDRRDGVMAVDAAVREGIVQSPEVAQALERARGWPGVRQAREVLGLADPRAESPLESLTRLALHDDGFPAPVLQAEIGGYRVDMLWPDARLVLEMDGRDKYTAEELWREKRREHRLRELGYRVERVLWVDVTRNWPATSARLRRMLRVPA